jgi:hypothetical protein
MYGELRKRIMAIKFLSERRRGFKECLTINDMNLKCGELIEECVDRAARIINGLGVEETQKYLDKEQNQLDKLIVELKNGIGVNHNTKASQICYDYSRLYSITKNITDEELKVSDYDYSERWRYVSFRTITAISIALVILITSYIAHEVLQIPLPLSSMVR